MDRFARGNRIAAYFMGHEFHSGLNYHSDWNLLIPVWTKLPICYDPTTNNRINKDYIASAILNNNIILAWSTIIGYINKYILTV